jgi:hypothetical protein
MAVPENRDRWLNIAINPDNPNLLSGLDNLLSLGLIDDRQVRNLCQIQLSCPVKFPVVAPVPAATNIPPATNPAAVPLVRNIWTAFKDELSVRWLLFLGVFLVVLSSGVLAATQWQSFPAWGQYGVLWAYTIVFWVVGWWASRQSGLALTANTLKIVALLLVPVNFWAIDSFQLWQQPFGIFAAGWALLSMSLLVLLDGSRQQSRWPAIAYLLGSYLQLGWQIGNWATIAVYLAAIGAVGIWQRRQYFLPGRAWQWASLGLYCLAILLLRALFIVRLPVGNFGLAIGMMGWLVAQGELGAWRLVDRIDRISAKWQTGHQRLQLITRRTTAVGSGNTSQAIATILFISAWLIAMAQWSQKFPIGSSWQPFGVSLLILVWLGQRLQLRQRRIDLIALFIVGLQAYAISFSLGTDFLVNLAKWNIWAQLQSFFGENAPWALTLVVMPYLLAWIGIWSWLLRKKAAELASTSLNLILITGLISNICSLPNQLGLLLNLLISTLALIYISGYQPGNPTASIYTAHGYGWLTVSAALQYAFPTWQLLPDQLWHPASQHPMLGTIALLVTVLIIGEWLISTQPAIPHSKQDIWYRSAWHYGLAASGITYTVYAQTYGSNWPWGWFMLPIALSWLSSHNSQLPVEIPKIAPWQLDRPRQAAIGSIGSILLGQILMVGRWDWRCLGLSLAIGLMFFNVRRLQTRWSAAIHIGCGVFLSGYLLERSVSGSQWSIFGALICLLLWVAMGRLQRRSGDLALLYTKTCDLWALGLALLGIAISSLNYGSHNFGNLWVFTAPFQQPQNVLISSLILALGLSYRHHLFTQTWHIWAINWSLQLGLSAVIQLSGGNALILAVTNIAIAFALLGSTGRIKRWLAASDTNALLPWIYGCWGICLRLAYFNTYTGLLTIALGGISLLVGRKLRGLQISYLGLLAIALGCYELVTYQILQAPTDGNIADAFTIYGMVTAALALGYRLWIWGWGQRGHERWLNIPVGQMQNIAHLHWAAASGWTLMAALSPALPIPQFAALNLATSILLGLYAIVQGRAARQTPSSSQPIKDDWWVYVGIAEILGTAIYARSLFNNLGVFDEFLILITCLLGITMMLAPWSQWGWHSRPWQQIALVLPLLRVVFITEEISTWNLLVIASFYGAIAKRRQQFLWVYTSLIFLNWAAFRLLGLYDLQDPLWFATILGTSLLIAVHFDPYFRPQARRASRHLARLWGSGVIALTALVFHQNTPLLPAGISLLFILGGTALCIRAFLYIGTVTFILTASYQLIILITEYSFTKWIVGLIAGVAIIAIAGNFERRRTQISTAFSNWLDRLQEWQ